METLQRETGLLDWQRLLRLGLIAGIVILYTSMIGMTVSFNNRPVVRQLFTLGQVLLFAPPLVASYFYGSRIYANAREHKRSLPLTAASVLVSGAVVGALASVPVLVMLWLHSRYGLNTIFVNVNRNLIDILTFDRRNDQVVGGLILAAATAAAGFAGAVLVLFPAKPRRALSFGVFLVLTIGIMGETTRLVLQQILPRSLLDKVLRRSELLQPAALGLFIFGTLVGILWVYGRQSITQQYQKVPVQQKTILQWVLYGLVIGFLVALPSLIGRALSDVMVTVGLYVLMGLGLNIAIGLAGLLDLGYVTNYAVGAYITGVLTSTGMLGIASKGGGDPISFWIAIPIALLAAMFAGFILAVPVLKMRGDYLAIATLGFGEIIGKLAVSDWFAPLIGGAQGLLFIPNPNFLGTEIKDPEQLYYVILAACAATLFVSVRLNNSRIGRTWMAVREDEDVAAAMGIDVARAKLLAFTISAATGGVAGAIFATKVGSVFPNSFTVFISINVLSLIIVGGMGSNFGIVLGALVLVGMPELLREFSEYRWLLYGILLIFMMINRPEGLFPSQVRRRELHSDQPPPLAAGD